MQKNNTLKFRQDIDNLILIKSDQILLINNLKFDNKKLSKIIEYDKNEKEKNDECHKND